MNLTLRQLRAFIAVAELGSFTEAARRLSLTQAATSVLIKELEAELGTRMLDRHTRSVKLTDAGREFLPYVLRMLEDLGEGVSTVQTLRDKRRGLVRIAAPQLMACTLMPRIIAAYQRQFPDIEVRLTDTLPQYTLNQLLSAEAELAIGPDVAIGQDLIRLPLIRDSHFLICPLEHPLAKRKHLRWADLCGHAYIAPTRDFMDRLQPELTVEDRELVITPAHEVSFMTTAIGMVAAGLGVTTCPSYAAPLVKAYGLAMKPLASPEFIREVAIFHLSRRSLSPAAESFLEFSLDFVANDGHRS
jgi:DNA-binding transcriptional LysR family regulator